MSVFCEKHDRASLGQRVNQGQYGEPERDCRIGQAEIGNSEKPQPPISRVSQKPTLPNSMPDIDQHLRALFLVVLLLYLAPAVFRLGISAQGRRCSRAPPVSRSGQLQQLRWWRCCLDTHLLSKQERKTYARCELFLF
jgi:hypothetical protein